MRSVLKELFTNTTIYIIMCVATLLMLRTIIGYTGFDTNYAFLSQKQDYLQNKIWLTFFYIHVFSSIFTLIAGFTQFSNYVLEHYRPVHRIMGRLYVFAVILINVPSAFVMAIYANGLLPSKIAFMILDCLWFYFTLMGWRTAVRLEFNAHRNWMIRSFALTFSAITLRTWKAVLNPFIDDNLILYMTEAWMGFVPNLLFAEWYIRSYLPLKISQKSHETRNTC